MQRARGEESPPLPLLAVQLDEAVGALVDDDQDQEQEHLRKRDLRVCKDLFIEARKCQWLKSGNVRIVQDSAMHIPCLDFKVLRRRWYKRHRLLQCMHNRHEKMSKPSCER